MYPRVAGQSLVWVCGLVLLALVTTAGLWFATGGRLYSVQTGSMVPTFRPGDCVLVRETKHIVPVGTVIAYHNPQNPKLVISHRVIRDSLDRNSLLTKGDHNHLADTPINQSQVIGRVVAVAPRLGRLLHWLRSPLGVTTVVYLPGAALVGFELWRTSQALHLPTYRHQMYNREFSHFFHR